MTTAEALTLLGVVVSLGVGIVGWRQAVRAGRRAESAERRAKRAEQVALEPSDVHWVHARDEGRNSVVFTNSGTTPAVEVVIVVDRDGFERVCVETAEVPPMAQVSVPGLPERKMTLAVFGDSEVSTQMVVPGVARLRWRTPLGRPSSMVMDC